MLNSNFTFFFETTESNPCVGKNYTVGGQKYLVVGLAGCSISKRKLNCLLVPKDNSDLANHIRNNPYAVASFNTPFSNLKFERDFWKNSKGNIIYDGLIIKDINQVKKDSEKVEEFSVSSITFKVLSQKKKMLGKEGKYYE